MHSSRGENQTPYKIDHHGLHKRWTSEIDDAGNSFDVEQPHFYTLIHEVQKQVHIPMPSNACFGFDSTTGWTFFDLNSLHDEYRDELGTVVEADFYHANQFLPLSDDQIVKKVKEYLATCINGFRDAEVVDQAVVRFPKAVTHFFPGSYQYMMRGTTSFPNVFMAGDWIVNRHGSWSQVS
jgi:uncharacterized protein with NAD-binding domain and iron-sulfur cluster